MKKILLVILVLGIFNSCGNQHSATVSSSDDIDGLFESLKGNADYANFEQGFSTYLCQCTASSQDQLNLTMLPNKYVVCSKEYISQNQAMSNQLIEYWVEENKIANTNNILSAQLGKILERQSNRLLANNCSFFKQEFVKLKAMFIAELGINSMNVESKLLTFENELSNVRDPEELSNLYTILGVVNEYIGQNSKAKEYYSSGEKLGAVNSGICGVLVEMVN